MTSTSSLLSIAAFVVVPSIVFGQHRDDLIHANGGSALVYVGKYTVNLYDWTDFTEPALLHEVHVTFTWVVRQDGDGLSVQQAELAGMVHPEKHLPRFLFSTLHGDLTRATAYPIRMGFSLAAPHIGVEYLFAPSLAQGSAFAANGEVTIVLDETKVCPALEGVWSWTTTEKNSAPVIVAGPLMLKGFDDGSMISGYLEREVADESVFTRIRKASCRYVADIRDSSMLSDWFGDDHPDRAMLVYRGSMSLQDPLGGRIIRQLLNDHLAEELGPAP